MKDKSTQRKEQFTKVPRRIVKELSGPELRLWCAVKLNAHHYETTLTALATLLTQDRTTVAKTAKKLVERGYLIQKSCPSNPREYRFLVQDSK